MTRQKNEERNKSFKKKIQKHSYNIETEKKKNHWLVIFNCSVLCENFVWIFYEYILL